MNNETMILLFIAFVLLAAGLVIWFVMRKQRSQKLREKFGPEYALAMEKTGDQHTAEKTLGEREKRVVELKIHELDKTGRERYSGEWLKIQTDFVDDPSKSLDNANQLITEVMIARGFPVADFDQRAADLSVMVPNFVSNYRNANDIALKNQRKEASTEEIRQAMVYYRSLFEELLGTEEDKEVEETKKGVLAQ